MVRHSFLHLPLKYLRTNTQEIHMEMGFVSIVAHAVIVSTVGYSICYTRLYFNFYTIFPTQKTVGHCYFIMSSIMSRL
jgi:hypothetical protein